MPHAHSRFATECLKGLARDRHSSLRSERLTNSKKTSVTEVTGNNMIIDKQLLDTLSAQAKASPRLRQAYDLRNTPEDNS